ncbi:MAG: hypothetical protein AAFO91_04365, partial [Bacteroidota bacterium]
MLFFLPDSPLHHFSPNVVMEFRSLFLLLFLIQCHWFVFGIQLDQHEIDVCRLCGRNGSFSKPLYGDVSCQITNGSCTNKKLLLPEKYFHPEPVDESYDGDFPIFMTTSNRSMELNLGFRAPQSGLINSTDGFMISHGSKYINICLGENLDYEQHLNVMFGVRCLSELFNENFKPSTEYSFDIYALWFDLKSTPVTMNIKTPNCKVEAMENVTDCSSQVKKEPVADTGEENVESSTPSWMIAVYCTSGVIAIIIIVLVTIPRPIHTLIKGVYSSHKQPSANHHQPLELQPELEEITNGEGKVLVYVRKEPESDFERFATDLIYFMRHDLKIDVESNLWDSKSDIQPLLWQEQVLSIPNIKVLVLWSPLSKACFEMEPGDQHFKAFVRQICQDAFYSRKKIAFAALTSLGGKSHNIPDSLRSNTPYFELMEGAERLAFWCRDSEMFAPGQYRTVPELRSGDYEHNTVYGCTLKRNTIIIENKGNDLLQRYEELIVEMQRAYSSTIPDDNRLPDRAQLDYVPPTYEVSVESQGEGGGHISEGWTTYQGTVDEDYADDECTGHEGLCEHCTRKQLHEELINHNSIGDHHSTGKSKLDSMYKTGCHSDTSLKYEVDPFDEED